MPSTSSVERPENQATVPVAVSRALLLIASIALVGNCLITSPSAFKQIHKDDTGPLKLVVSMLALTTPSGERGAFPTIRGVEIRDLFYYSGAALLLGTAGLHLLTRRRPPLVSIDYFMDLRSRAASPFAWLVLMVFISLITSAFSHAPDVSAGPVVIRFLHLAWWWPLAVLLRPDDARRLAAVAVGAIAVTAAVGLWYHIERVVPNVPHDRLSYPIGNPTWFAALLLSAPLVAAGLMVRRFCDRAARGGPRRMVALAGWMLAAAVSLAALYLTHARAAQAGLAAGVAFLVFLAASRRWRPLVALAVMAMAAYGAHYIQQKTQAGGMGERAHSMRSRFYYEWPYALRLFWQKPVGGHGEGCYTMLAGQFAREDQLHDPSVMASDELKWTANAHNEYLELLADIGLAGSLGFVLALGTTLWWSVRYCDRLRAGDDVADDTGAAPSPGDQWLAGGLACALVALMVEEAGSVGLRQPGLPAVFYTVWACLWALARAARPRRLLAEEDAAHRLPTGAMRLFAAVCLAGSVVLGIFAVNDWRAARAAFTARTLLNEGRFAEAAAPADFAARHLLDPMQNLLARTEAIRVRAFEFNRIVNRSAEGPTAADLELSQAALSLLDELKNAAPRFLGVSRLEWMLLRDRATAHDILGEPVNATDFDDRALAALERNRADEPFDVGLIEMLWYDPRVAAARQRRWQRGQDAGAVARHLRERLGWIQALLRRRGIDDQVADFVRSFGDFPGAMDLVRGVLAVAQKDAAAAPGDWQDPLAPEMFRIAAALADWSDRPNDAVRLTDQAEAMYQRLGSPVFVARSEALREGVLYRLHADPAGGVNEKLHALATAHELMEGPLPGEGAGRLSIPLPFGPGRSRLLVLLAAGRNDEAMAQARRLAGNGDSAAVDRLLAQAYADLAGRFLSRGRETELAFRWAREAVRKDMSLPVAQYLLVVCYLERTADEPALTAARRFIDAVPDRAGAFARLRRLEERWPGRPLWSALRAAYADFPPPPEQPTTSAEAPESPSATVEPPAAPSDAGDELQSAVSTSQEALSAADASASRPADER